MTPSERARTLEAGSELDALFFETCWGWRKEMLRDPTTQDESKWSGAWLEKERMPWTYCRPVSTDANACEAWAMRWARENGLLPQITIGANDALVVLFSPVESHPIPLITAKACGTDWKAAFVRACIVAAEAMKLNAKGT